MGLSHCERGFKAIGGLYLLHSQSHLSYPKCRRNQGTILSSQDWQKLMQAGVLDDDFGDRDTYEQSSERSSLDDCTVSRLLSGEVKVDKRTLKNETQ